jgi:multidrug resistance efflux pump
MSPPEGKPVGASTNGIFRPAAVAAHLGDRAVAAPLLAAPAWTSTVILAALAIVLVAIGAAFFLSIDVSARASGTIRADQGGTQMLAAQGSGIVAEVLVRSGDVVGGGDAIMAFDVASLRAELLEAERKVAIVRELAASEEARTARQSRSLRATADARESSLRSRAASFRGTAVRLMGRLERVRRGKDEGVTTITEVEEVEEQLATALRNELALDDEAAQVHAQTVAAVAAGEGSVERLRRDARDAEAHRDAVAYALDHSKVVAPGAGTIDTVFVRAGDTVSVGTPVARIVPPGATSQAVVFLPERDRAFLTEATPVRIELAQLPVTEFGALRGRVTRIGGDVATLDEIRAVLGPQTDLGTPTFRVEVAIQEDARRERFARFLRPGSAVSARFALRRRRLIGVLFEPLRPFFP